MKSFITGIVEKIVDEPTKIEIIQTQDKDGEFYEIRVADADIGKVIGRGGAVAVAIRTLVKAIAMKQGKRAQIDVYSPKRLTKGE